MTVSIKEIVGVRTEDVFVFAHFTKPSGMLFYTVAIIPDVAYL